MKAHKQFKRVKTREEATAMLIFIRSDLSRYGFTYKDKFNNDLSEYGHEGAVTRVFLKHSNPHDSKHLTIGYIRAISPAKKRIN